MLRSRLWYPFLFVASLVALAAPRAQASLLDDLLNGPCCTPTVAQLPQFPGQELETKYICWQDCDVRLSGNVKASLRLRPAACGYYLLRYNVTNLPGTRTIWSGSLVAAYSRTWAESQVAGELPNLQVWRFLINGDLVIDPQIVQAFGNNTCVVPASYNTFGRLHVSGYADWVLNCDTGEWSVAYALGHECDPIEHDNSFSCRPGTFNRNRSYNWVGPAPGFVCEPNVPVAEGPIRCEAFRRFDFTQPLNMICETEQPISQGQIETIGEFCPCGPAVAVAQYKIQALTASTVCNSFAGTTPVEVWSGLLGKSIGFWTDPDVYPGLERLHLSRGFFDYADGCGLAGGLEYFLGVQTQGGFDTWKIILGDLTPVPNRLIDLGNAKRSVQGGPPVIGKRYVTDKLMYFNVEIAP